MKTLQRLFVALIAIGIIFSASTGVYAHDDAAEKATFTLNSGTYTQNSVVPIMVYEDSGNMPVNIAELYLRYDTTKLQYMGVDPSDTAFGDITAPKDMSGKIRVLRAVMPFGSSVTGKVKFAVINFKALAASGTTQVSIGSGSGIAAKGSNIWDKAETLGTVTFAAPSTPAAVSKPQAPTPVTVSPSTPKKVAQSTSSQAVPATLGASTQAVPKATAVNTLDLEDTSAEPMTTVATMRLDTSSNTNLYLTGAYAFAISILAASLLVVRRRYKLAK